MYEVEQKFPVPNPAETRRLLQALGASFREPVEQVDLYLAHPSRDFRATDEAFRIRRVGSEVRCTYKGPKVDAVTKTRREIECRIDAPWQEFLALTEALGFRPVFEVVKTREAGSLQWNGLELDVALDDVRGLGQFVEIEAAADETNLHSVRDRLLVFAEKLALGAPERRGYLDLLMEKLPRSG